MADSDRGVKALAILGAAAAGVVAFKALRTAAYWAYVRCGPVLASQFKGEYALVTGGSEGIGLGIAEALAARGVNLVLVSRSEDKLVRAARYLGERAPGVDVKTIAADLTADGAAAKVVAALEAAGVKDKVSLLVCNQGGLKPRAVPYQDYTDEELEYARKLNGEATYSVVRALLPSMAERKRGFVLLTSSLITKMPFTCMSAYYLEKAKINALATLLQAEQDALGTGIGVQAHTLGAVVTPALASIRAGAAAAGADKAALGWEQGVVTPSLSMPSAKACGEWIVRAMGKGGAPVATPYVFHAASEAVLDALTSIKWPAFVRRGVAAKLHGDFAKGWEKK